MQKYIINQHDYARLQSLDCEGIDDSMTYQNFVEWNMQCYTSLSSEDKNFVLLLCDKISMLRLVDIHSATSFSSHAIYFDSNKNLCIASPQ